MAIRDYPSYVSKHPNYIYVDDVDAAIDEILKVAEDTKDIGSIISVDTETDYDENIKGVSKFIQGNPNNNPFCVTLYCGNKGYYISKDLDKLGRLFSNPLPHFVFHNHKYDRHMLANINLNLDINQIEDTMLMIHLINEEFECRQPDGSTKRTKRLKDLAYHFLGNDAHELEDLVSEYRAIKGLHNKADGIEGGKNNVSYKEVEELNHDLMKDYACADVDFTYHLYFKFLPELKRQLLEEAYALDKGASDALFKMERRGVKVDVDYYTNLYKEYGDTLKELDAKLVDMTGIEEFSVDKEVDVVKAYNDLGIIWSWKTESKKDRIDKKVLKGLLKQFSTNEKVCDLTNTILERRDLAKTRDTFIKNMLEYCQWDGRVHPDFNVCPNDFDAGATRTGRLSSSNPKIWGSI